MQVKIKRLNENAVVPKYAKDGDAGMDLTAISHKFENDHDVYGTGLAIEIPEGYVGLIFPRSSISKKDQNLSNAVGVVDSGYRGEVIFKFKRTTNNSFTYSIYEVGERVGQVIIMPYPKVELVEVQELSSSERGAGGFGSSGS